MQQTSESVAKSCPQCGASVELPPEQIASLCAFCASPLVAAEDASQAVDRVAPFDLNKVQAGNLLAQHLQERRFIPTSLRFAGQPENLRGVLVPFWCYDATTHSSWQARQGVHWYRTETYTTTVNGKKVTRTRQVKETEWFQTSGSHVGSYDDHLVSGSRGLSEPEANALEPFDLGRSLPYSPALLAGWTAERPTVPKDVARATANQELANVENSAIQSFLPADRVSDVENQTSIQVSELELVMLPVWVGTYRHKDSVLRLLVNGQTGEVVADLPTSWAKVFLAFLGALLLLCAAAGILALFNGVLQ